MWREAKLTSGAERYFRFDRCGTDELARFPGLILHSLSAPGGFASLPFTLGKGYRKIGIVRPSIYYILSIPLIWRAKSHLSR
jgi:hypothetical protein